MPYLVKYVDECVTNGIDCFDLYDKDLKNGYGIVLIAKENNRNYFFNKNIREVKTVEEIKSQKTGVMVAYSNGDAMLDGAVCANSLYASEYQIYTAEDGIFSAAPENTVFAQRLDKIDYDEVMEMCGAGYKNIDINIVEYCRKHSVVMHVFSYNNPAGKGTVVKEVMGIAGLTIKGVIKDPNICIISLKDIPDIPGISYHIFKTISDAGVIVDIINLPAAFGSTQDISFTVMRQDKKKAENALLENQENLKFSNLIVNDNVAKVSVVGGALRSSSGVATTVFKILYENDINLRLINTSEIKISVVIDKSVSDLAVQKIHQAFID